jgi:DNA-binding CsgD family transcriptional regulator
LKTEAPRPGHPAARARPNLRLAVVETSRSTRPSPRATSAKQRQISPLLIGRASEMSVLAEAFDEVAAGSQRTILISAEGGGGKSRLIREACESFRERALILAGWCVEQGEPGLPFAPFVSIVRQVVRDRGVADIAALVGRESARELGRLLPELGPSPSEGDPGMARSRLFEALRTLLEALAAQASVVVVLEDLHWADRATRDLLVYLARNLQSARLLLLASYRSEAVNGAHGLRTGVAELIRIDGVTALSLPRLSRGEVALQLQALLGHEPATDVVAAVHARGSGVPLFTEALLAPDGSVRHRLPGSLLDLLLGAVNELPERARDVLRAMAVGGLRVGHRLLAAAAGGEGLEAALRAAVSCHLLVADGDAGYAFRHALIQEAIRDDLLPGERRRLHRGYAQALDADASLAEDVWVAGALASHWRAAGDHGRSLAAAWRAVGEAAARLAYAEQLSMLEHVLESWQRVEPARRPPGVERPQVLEAAADAACWAVEPTRGQAVVEAALAELDPAVDGERIAAMLLQRAMMRQQQMHAGELDDLQGALRLLPGPSARRAETLGQFCRALYLHGRIDECGPLAAELSSLAARLGEPEWQVEAWVAEAIGRSPHEAGTVLLLHRALHTAEFIASGRLEMIALVALADVLDARGEHAAAVNIAQSAWHRASQLGQARYIGASVAQWLARSLMAVGRWDDAVEVIGEALELDPSPLGRAQLALVSGQIACARGNVGTAQRCSQLLRAAPSGPQDAPRRAAVAAQLSIEIALANGDHAAAIAACRELETLRAELPPRDLWPLIATAWRACSEAKGSEALRGMLSESWQQLPQPGAVERAYASTTCAEGSRSVGRLDAKAWGAAGALWEELGQPHALAYALMRQGSASLATGDRGAARTALRRAAHAARQLGAAPLQTRIAMLAQKARVDLWPDETSPSTASPLGLTARELEVLKLVAEGRTNREIAADLFITVKTASVHVSNILAKFEVSSRGAAAAAAHRLGLVKDA